MKHAVMGEGWEALVAVSDALASGEEVVWFGGSGTRTLPILPFLPDDARTRGILSRWEDLGLSFEERELGSDGLREFRGGVFRKLPTSPENEEELGRFSPLERSLFGTRQIAFRPGLSRIEASWREALLAHEGVERREPLPVSDLRVTSGGVSVSLGSGESWEFSGLVYADAWAKLHSFPGLSSKELRAAAKIPSVSVLQVSLRSQEPVPFADAGLGFLAILQKEAGDEEERRMWGGFLEDPLWSRWSLFLDRDEAEDNHAVSKRIRRIHQSLVKMTEASGGSFRALEEAIRLETGVVPSLPAKQTVFGPLRLAGSASLAEVSFRGTSPEASTHPHP